MKKFVISSGHGLHVGGASGVINEVEEARKVVDALASVLFQRGFSVTTFHDNSSTSQSENLNTIVNFHNSQSRDLDISCHFNAYCETEKPMGCEVLYVTQEDLARTLSNGIATAGSFIDRGPKYRSDLAFLNGTDMPAVLLEICFVDSETDCSLYQERFDAIVNAIADVLTGGQQETVPQVHITTSGYVRVFLNGRSLS